MLTTKGWITVVTILVVFAVGLILQRWFLLLFDLPLLYTVLLSLSYLPASPSEIEVNRYIEKRRFIEGDELSVTIQFKNKSEKTVILAISEKLEPPLEVVSGDTRGMFVLKPGEEQSLKYKVRSSKRGHYSLGPTLVEAFEPFMLQKKSLVSLPPDEIVFLPMILRKYRLSLKASYTLPRHGEIASRRQGEGGDFLEIREAQEIILRRVNWKATAKTQRWMINAFEGERLTSVLVVLDVSGKRLLGEKIDEYIDDIVRVAASIVYTLINAGNRVSLLIVGNYRDWIKPGSGKRHALWLLSSLADVRFLPTRQIVEYEEVFKRISLLISPKGSSVVIVSSFTEKDIFKVIEVAERMGYSLTCVAVNPFHKRLLKDEALYGLLATAWKQGIVRILPSRGRKVILVEPQ
ncbi:MAG: DUF58 domain-containing protein [Infirmifilum sp.]